MLSWRVVYPLLLLGLGFACVGSATSAGITEAQFGVTAQVNGTCTVNLNWLVSVIDHTTTSTCADGTPVQIYVDQSRTQGTQSSRVAIQDNNDIIHGGGVDSCGEETSSNGDGSPSAVPLQANEGGGLVRKASRLTVVSACF
jgi:hypothetical protein